MISGLARDPDVRSILAATVPGSRVADLSVAVGHLTDRFERVDLLTLDLIAEREHRSSDSRFALSGLNARPGNLIE
jgi:hypothetical protein